MKKILFVVMLLMPLISAAQEMKDSVDRNAPDFVKASVMIASPGDVLYSCVGHACLRLECPTYKLDYCFSYEGEDVEQKVLTFFMGGLKMGMFAIPTAEYLKQYENEGRGVKQYTLNLAPEVKTRLWKILDDRVAEGADLPYDYVNRGCAVTTLQNILDALYGEDVVFDCWTEQYDKTRREIFANDMANYPWTMFLINTICGEEGDREVNNKEKVMAPVELVRVLQNITVDGQPLITAEPVELLPNCNEVKKTPFTPVMLSLILLLLAIVGVFVCKKPITMFFLVLQTVVGVAITYLVFISDLPCMGWSWLVIPFNPLPALLWKWRKYWALPFAVILLAWDIVILLLPHLITSYAYIITVFALAVVYFATNKVNNTKG